MQVEGEVHSGTVYLLARHPMNLGGQKLFVKIAEETSHICDMTIKNISLCDI